jgi:hypothetical protein
MIRAEKNLPARLLRPSTGIAGHALHNRLDGRTRPGRIEALHALDNVGEAKRVVARAQTTCDFDDELPRRAWIATEDTVAAGWPEWMAQSPLEALT